MIYGYARVSSDGQSTVAQVEELRRAGAEKIYSEKVSGANIANRKEMAKVIAKLEDGDTLLVTKLDRLARSTLDLLSTLDTLSKRGAGFRSLGEEWANTTSASGRLMVTILGGFAEFERALINSRTAAGRERAKLLGLHMGRRPKLTEAQRAYVAKERAAGLSTRELGRAMNVSHNTIARIPALEV